MIRRPPNISVHQSLIGLGRAEVPHKHTLSASSPDVYASTSLWGSLLRCSSKYRIIRMYTVGTPEKNVRPPCLKRFHVHFGSKGPLLNSIQAPACKERKKLIQIPVAWCTGRQCKSVSWSDSRKIRARATTQSVIAAFRKTVPLGGPVVPDVNITRPGALGLT